MSRFLLISLAVLLTGCGHPKQKLNIFVWSEYIDPKIIADFEREFDCKVTVDLFEDFNGMLSKLAGGGSSVYDVIATGNFNLSSLIKRGLVAPLRHENIPNLKHIDSEFANPPFDPNNQYGAPCSWGTAGLYVRKSKDKPLEESWSLIFDPVKQIGPFLFVEDARFCIGAALWYKGRSGNTSDPKALAEARDLLIDAKRRSLGFEGYTGCKNRILSKGAVVAMATNGDAARGMLEDPETYFFVPTEGGLKFLNTLSVSAQAPHRDLAEKFINYLLEPRVAAQFSAFSQMATPNKAAMEFIGSADRTNAILFPQADVMRRLEYIDDAGESNKLYDEIWTQIKAK